MTTWYTTAELADTGHTMLVWGGPSLVLGALLLVAVHLVERRRAPLPPDGQAMMGNALATGSGLLAGVLSWVAWFSWSGPGGRGTALTVAAVASTFGVLVWLSVRTRWPWTGPFVVSLAGLAGFSTSYAVAGDAIDGTGLWAVGYLMVTVGGMIVLALVSAGIVVVRSADWTR
jgi:hypothetical protein